jgi:hypothetical protein
MLNAPADAALVENQYARVVVTIVVEAVVVSDSQKDLTAHFGGQFKERAAHLYSAALEGRAKCVILRTLFIATRPARTSQIIVGFHTATAVSYGALWCTRVAMFVF